jgi:hypothetical protein
MSFDTRFVFQAERSIGTVINDTISFARSNFRDLFQKTWKIVLPFIILMIGANILYSYSISSLFSGEFQDFELKNILFIFVYIVISVFFGSIMQLSVSVYIMKYIEGNEVTATEIKNEVYRRIAPLLGLNFLYGLIITVGFLFFIFPGIYFSVILIFSIPILIYERQNISDSISKSFDLVRGNWWTTFGSLLVISLFILSISFAFSIINSMVVIIESLFQKNTELQSFSKTLLNNPVHLIISIISWIFYSVFMYFVNIALSLIYFDLKEKKDQTMVYKQLDSIGNE